MKTLSELVQRSQTSRRLRIILRKGLIGFEKNPDNPRLAYYELHFSKSHVIQETVHEGALTTIVDISTTISILKMIPLK